MGKDAEPFSTTVSTASRHAAFRAGFVLTGGLAAGTAVFGALFGAAAVAHGLPDFQILLMSATVFAGSAQFAALELWATPPLILPLAIAVFLVCSRHLLLGATLPALFGREGGRPVPFALLFLLSDANWALTRVHGQRWSAVEFILGSSTALYVGWLFGTAAGTGLARVVDAATLTGLASSGALFLAVLLAMLARQDGGRNVPAWLVSALVAWGIHAVAGAAVAIPAGVAAGAVAVLCKGTNRDG